MNSGIRNSSREQSSSSSIRRLLSNNICSRVRGSRKAYTLVGTVVVGTVGIVAIVVAVSLALASVLARVLASASASALALAFAVRESHTSGVARQHA